MALVSQVSVGSWMGDYIFLCEVRPQPSWSGYAGRVLMLWPKLDGCIECGGKDGGGSNGDTGEG